MDCVNQLNTAIVSMQGLIKKQDLFESEVKVHCDRVGDIEKAGMELVVQVNIFIIYYVTYMYIIIY